jgi:predicted nuclease of restriction endonuclease-like RecB superfamily
MWIMRQTLEDIETKMEKLEANIKRYRDSTKRRSFGSKLARLKGGDSFFELRVKKLLARYRIQFKYNEVLKLGLHRYRPDFLIGNKTIIETAGVPTEYYWKHYSEKVKDYVDHGYVVYVIVLDKLLEKAMNYFPKSAEIRIIKYSDFKWSAEEYLRSLATNGELPS